MLPLRHEATCDACLGLIRTYKIVSHVKPPRTYPVSRWPCSTSINFDLVLIRRIFSHVQWKHFTRTFFNDSWSVEVLNCTKSVTRRFCNILQRQGVFEFKVYTDTQSQHLIWKFIFRAFEDLYFELTLLSVPDNRPDMDEKFMKKMQLKIERMKCDFENFDKKLLFV